MYFTLQILEYNCQSGYESSDEHQVSPLYNTNFPAAQIKLSVQVGELALSFGYFSYIHFQLYNVWVISWNKKNAEKFLSYLELWIVACIS